MLRRILLFVTDLEIGGTPTVIRELATRLNDPPRVEIEVGCLKGWGPVAEQIRDAGVAVTAFGVTSPLQIASAVRQLRDFVRGRGIDTVFSFLVHANAVAAMASRKLEDVRFLQSIQTTQPWPAWHWRVQKWIAASAERIVTPSNAVARVARERSDISADHLVVIPNAIDLAEFERFDVFEKPPIRVGFIGRLDPVKNIDALIAAMQHLEDLEIECHIFGEGPERTRLERMIVAPRVFFRGVVASPQDALREMDVLVLPSTGEGFGLVLIEAMAAGVPVIAAASGGVFDVIRDGVNGLLVRDDFPREIAAHVRRLHEDVALRTRLIDNGVQTVREKFNWDVALPMYRRLLGI